MRAMIESDRQFPNKVFRVKNVLEDGDLVAIAFACRSQGR
jgi:hypothetical protein